MAVNGTDILFCILMMLLFYFLLIDDTNVIHTLANDISNELVSTDDPTISLEVCNIS